ncbi:polysaccharide deacetylase family protein [bacterium CPR1]|nr:polysaccharide deacetylase family protein [bacterium CPR1]
MQTSTRTDEDKSPEIEARSLWGWVHDHHQQAYLAGTALLAGLYALSAPPGRRLERWTRAFAGAAAVGAVLDPLVNPGNPGLSRVRVHGPRGRRAVALTFDDGPEPPYTERILDILGEFAVKATFFVVGSQVLHHPELARRILDGSALPARHAKSWLWPRPASSG